MKKILLFALLSFGINASIVVIDLGRIENEVRVLFPDSTAMNSFWKNDWPNDVEAWRKERRLNLVWEIILTILSEILFHVWLFLLMSMLLKNLLIG
jgi:hypothetical protein